MTNTRNNRRIASLVIRGGISVALIVLIVVNLDTATLAETLVSVSALTLIVLTIVDLILRVLSAYRWHVLFRNTNASSSLSEITQITFVSSFLGQVMPGVIGVEALRVYGLAKSSGDAGGAFASVVADRIFGLLSLVIVIFIGLIIGPRELQTLILAPALIALGALVVAVLLIMIPATRRLFERSLPSVLLSKIRHWIDDVYSCLDRYRTQPGLLAYSLFLAITFQIVRVLLFYIGALMIGQSPPFTFMLALVPIVMFAALLPISISGLGVREAGLVVLFAQFGVMDSASAFTVAILVFVSGLLSTLPGGWYYVRNRKRLTPIMERASS